MLNLRCKISFTNISNQNRQLTVLMTAPGSACASRFCAAGLYYFCDVTKPHRMSTMR